MLDIKANYIHCREAALKRCMRYSSVEPILRRYRSSFLSGSLMISPLSLGMTTPFPQWDDLSRLCVRKCLKAIGKIGKYLRPACEYQQEQDETRTRISICDIAV